MKAVGGSDNPNAVLLLYLESPLDGVLRAARDLSRNRGPLLAQASLRVYAVHRRQVNTNEDTRARTQMHEDKIGNKGSTECNVVWSM